MDAMARKLLSDLGQDQAASPGHVHEAIHAGLRSDIVAAVEGPASNDKVT